MQPLLAGMKSEISLLFDKFRSLFPQLFEKSIQTSYFLFVFFQFLVIAYFASFCTR